MIDAAGVFAPGTNGCPRPVLSHRTLRGGYRVGPIPGNKLPGYHHSVPPGHKQTGSGGPVVQFRRINTPTLRSAEIEDDDEYEDEYEAPREARRATQRTPGSSARCRQSS